MSWSSVDLRHNYSDNLLWKYNSSEWKQFACFWLMDGNQSLVLERGQGEFCKSDS